MNTDVWLLLTRGDWKDSVF